MTETKTVALSAFEAAMGKQMRMKEEELSLIRNTFKDNLELLKLMRKIFLPEIDPTAPLGQNIDLWMTVDIKDQTPADAIINLKARNMLINHVDQQLLQLWALAFSEPLSKEQILEQAQKNSSK